MRLDGNETHTGNGPIDANPLKALSEIEGTLHAEPLVFSSESEFQAYIDHPGYELDEDRPGMCVAILVDENLSDPEVAPEDKKVRVEIYGEATRGTAPGSGQRFGALTSQTTIPNTGSPAYDRYSKNPNAHAASLYVAQGYSWIQNWAANAALRQLTQNPKARIDLSLTPFQQSEQIKDDFEDVLKGVYSYISLIIYILPMYTYILRMQVEKQQGLKRHLNIIGLSFKAQYLAEFVSYTAHLTLISIGIFLAILGGGLFPKSMANSKFLMFSFLWVQGISNFGFIVMIVNLLPQNMYPKLAAKWGSLMYFSSAFVDFTIQKVGIAESTKTLMCLAFPTLSVARASKNIAIFEYTPGGTGLNFDDTLFKPYHNFRVITYFFVMAYALVFHFMVGMIFERYGSVPQILKNLRLLVLGQSDDDEGLAGKKEGQAKRKVRELDPGNFEAGGLIGQDLAARYPDAQTGAQHSLRIHELVKRFKEHAAPGEAGAGSGFLTAVDHLNLQLYSGQIFALLGHNGAGKTTTISMLTGMLEATSGGVECFGRTAIAGKDGSGDPLISQVQQSKDLEYIKQVMGVCPQHDILFDTATVREHLDIYCDFKGVPSHLKKEKINKVMSDVGIEAFQDTMAENLSGGNRRKLSVALALVADSRLVLLDEPTSGMDLNARRRLWDMLKDYRQNRIIILTTHNMDEADLLGDRIGIMSQGQLVCVGSGSFLKGRYGCGYRLTVKKNPGVDMEKEIQKFLVQGLDPDTKLLQSNQFLSVYQIPKRASDKFPRFFEDFDQPDIQQGFGIKSYTVSVGSLEEVFLKVGEQQEEGGEEVHKEDSDQFCLTPEENLEINTYRNSQGSLTALCKQLYASISRQWLFYSRRRRETCFESLVPALMIFIGLSLTTIDFAEELPRRPLVPGLYPWKQRLLINENVFSSNLNLTSGEEDAGDFEDEDAWPSGLPVHIHPSQFAANLPGYGEGAFDVEYYEPLGDLQVEWKNETDRRQTEYEEAVQKAQGEYDAKYEDAMREWWRTRGARMWLAREELLMRANGTWHPGSHEEYELPLNPYKIKKAEVKLPEEVDRGASHWHKRFHTRLDETRRAESGGNDTVFPYRYGSYFVYEANNQTKQFKLATFLNATSQDGVALFPQFMYESVLKVAGGNPSLNYTVTSVPWPKNSRQRATEEAASGIFVNFVVGVAFSLIPASIVSRLVSAKEKGLYHMELVTGIHKRAYYLSFAVFDLLFCYQATFATAILFAHFDLHYWASDLTLLLYPLALIPYTYTTSFVFDKESTAQTFTIYLHVLLAPIASMLVFALRMVESTCYLGDTLVWVMRLVCPTFSVCQTILYGGCGEVLSRQREQIRYDLYESKGVGLHLLPSKIYSHAPMHPDNVRGDLVGLATVAIAYLVIFSRLEGTSWNKYEQWLEGSWLSYFFIHRYPNAKKISELGLDSDVLAEQARVQKCLDDKVYNPVSAIQFRKVYSVPFSKPVLAVENVSFAVAEGECFALLGVNGAGKSTTFKSLTNAVEPTGGSIRLLGFDLQEDFEDIRYRLGYCPQQQALFTNVTVVEHLNFYAELKGLAPHLRGKLITFVIDRLGIRAHMHKTAETLSGGNKRKLQTAIAILGNPLIILLDEPSAGMDPGARRFMWNVVSNITKERPQSCVILTTHSMEEADALSTKMGIMVRGGTFKCFGTSEHIKDKYGAGYETEFKLNNLSKAEISKKIEELSLDRFVGVYALSDFIAHCLSLGFVKKHLVGMVERTLLKMIHGINWHLHQPDQVSLTSDKFAQYFHSFVCLQTILISFEEAFGQVEIIESHGKEYFKIRLPKDERTLGSMYGFVEKNRTPEWGVKEYSIRQTTLEMIFNKFAEESGPSVADF